MWRRTLPLLSVFSTCFSPIRSDVLRGLYRAVRGLRVGARNSGMAIAGFAPERMRSSVQ
jgi:hypothetical protein